MTQVSMVAVDLAKSLFEVYGPDDETGKLVLRGRRSRSGLRKLFASLPPCRVGMEACATAHYWAREIAALGHEVVLIAPSRVRAFVPRGRKNDATDAAAIYEAMSQSRTRFIAVKSVDQQAILMLHRSRKLLVEQRTRLGNALRAHLAELGIVARQGTAGLEALLAVVADERDARLPAPARAALAALAAQRDNLDREIAELERRITAWHDTDAASRRLATIPQIGPIIASAAVATIGDARRFDGGRQCAAWLGLVPSQHSTAGKTRLGPITKAGDRYLRQLLVVAASGMIRRVRRDPGLCPWLAGLLARMPAKQAAVAYANKLARIIWALLARGETYRAPAGRAA